MERQTGIVQTTPEEEKKCLNDELDIGMTAEFEQKNLSLAKMMIEGNESDMLKEYSIKINDYNPHAFCLIRVELDEEENPCDWTFLYCNDALAKLEGLPKEKILGHRFFDLFPNGSRKWLKPYYESAYEGKVTSCNDISEEIDKYLQIEVFPTDEKGVCVCILRDIKGDVIEKAERSKELRLTVEKLEEEKRLNAQVQQYASAMGIVYPLAISLDYLKNEYHMIEYEQFLNKTAKWSGTVDELITVGASTIPDEEYANKFKNLFGREKALAAFRSGKKELTLEHPQWGDDGKIHWMETKVICLKCIGTRAEAISVSKCIDEEKMIEDTNAKLKEREFILNALSTDYEEVYFCDIDADTLHVVKSGNTAVIGTDGKYSEIGRYFFKDKVVVESSPDMLEKLSRKNLKMYLSNHEEFSIRYELKPDERGRKYCEARLVRVSMENHLLIVIGTHFIDSIIEEQLERQRIEREKDAETKKHYQIINALGSEYSPLYLVDVSTKHWEILNTENLDTTGVLLDKNVRYDDFDTALDIFINRYIVEEEREYLLKHMKLEMILEETPEVGIHSLNYDRMKDGMRLPLGMHCW